MTRSDIYVVSHTTVRVLFYPSSGNVILVLSHGDAGLDKMNATVHFAAILRS